MSEQPKKAASLREAALALWFGIDLHPDDKKALIEHGIAETKSYFALTDTGMSLVRGEIEAPGDNRLPTERHITDKPPLRKG